jgi:hypothetical protein
MRNYLNYLFFLSLALLSFLLDLRDGKCNELSVDVFMNLFWHHFISSFLWFGPFILGFYKLHLVSCILIYLGWKITGYCVLTIEYNRLCKLPKDTNLNDLFYRSSKIINQDYYYSIIALMIYDILKILY